MDAKCYAWCHARLRSAKTEIQNARDEMDRRSPSANKIIEFIDRALADLEAARREFQTEKQNEGIPEPKQIKLYQVKGHKSPTPAPIFETKKAAEEFQKEFGGEIEEA